jgi:hypothetical protein
VASRLGACRLLRVLPVQLAPGLLRLAPARTGSGQGSQRITAGQGMGRPAVIRWGPPRVCGSGDRGWKQTRTPGCPSGRPGLDGWLGQAGGLGPQHGVPRGRRWRESSATIATRGATARNRARRWEPFSPGGRGVARAAAAPAGVATQGQGRCQGQGSVLSRDLLTMCRSTAPLGQP